MTTVFNSIHLHHLENKSKHELTVISPCIRPQNLEAMRLSLDTNYVTRWIIVQDATKVEHSVKTFDEPWIIEQHHTSRGLSGNPQRNYALNKLQEEKYNGFVYFLDDDNVMHASFWTIYPLFRSGYFQTFDCEGTKYIGRIPKVKAIDTGMYCVDFSFIQNRWILDKQDADGRFIEAIWNRNKTKHIYFQIKASWYNKLR